MNDPKPTVEGLAALAAEYAYAADDILEDGRDADARTFALVSIAHSQAALALAARPLTGKGES